MFRPSPSIRWLQHNTCHMEIGACLDEDWYLVLGLVSVVHQSEAVWNVVCRGWWEHLPTKNLECAQVMKWRPQTDDGWLERQAAQVSLCVEKLLGCSDDRSVEVVASTGVPLQKHLVNVSWLKDAQCMRKINHRCWSVVSYLNQKVFKKISRDHEGSPLSEDKCPGSLMESAPRWLGCCVQQTTVGNASKGTSWRQWFSQTLHQRVAGSKEGIQCSGVYHPAMAQPKDSGRDEWRSFVRMWLGTPQSVPSIDVDLSRVVNAEMVLSV